MKRGVVALAVAFLALAGTGCIVTSVYPFYSDATVVFEPALLGRWLDSDAKTTWTFVKEGEKAYRMTSVEPNPGPEGDKGATETRNFIVHLLQLGGSRFLDAFPSDAPDLTVGTHFLAKMELRDGALRVRGMDTHAVDRVATNGPLHVHPGAGGSVSESGSDSETLFLAPTAQLQAFIRDHEAEIFDKNEGVMKRGQ